MFSSSRSAPSFPSGRVRERVLALTFLLAVVTYLDRVCIAAAAPFIIDDLHLTLTEMSVVFSAFTLAYSLFEIPSGWLGDVIGPRKVLTRIVLWWSAFTMLTGTARSLHSLVAIRFLFGAGEAGAFPNVARSFSLWFPVRERGRVNGMMFLGSRLGGMLSAPLALMLVTRIGWRAAFAVFGSVGFLWALAWYSWYRDRPADHPAMTAAELAWIEQDAGPAASPEPSRTPWRQLLRSRNLYAVCAMYFGFGYGLYFYFTWLPTYLIKVLGFSLVGGGLFAALPFLLAGIADVAGGYLTDHLTRTRGLRVGRCYLGCAAFLTCAALVFASTLPLPPVARAILLAAALASADLALAACWAAPIDIARDHAGVVTACMNTVGNLGGTVAPLVVSYAVDRLASWSLALDLTALVYALGAIAWLGIDPTRPIAPSSSLES